MGDLPFGGRVSVDGGVQSITLIHDHPRFFPVLLLYDRSPAIPPFPSHLRCTVTSLIPGRQADRRTLKPCSQRAFPIFHLRSTRRRDPSIRAFLPSFHGLAGIKLLPRRELMLPAVNSSYFSRRVIPRRRLPRLASL